MSDYQIAVIVGRFQPLHNLHKKLIDKGLSIAEKVIIVLGSDKKAPDIRNPFSAAEREKMIRGCFTLSENKRLVFSPVRDHLYNDNLWIAEIQNIVRNAQEELLEKEPEFTEVLHSGKLIEKKVALVGHFKDSTSYYLNFFPQWTFESFYVQGKDAIELNSQDIRKLYLTYKVSNSEPRLVKWGRIAELVPKSVENFLNEFLNTPIYTELEREFEYIEKYKEDTKPKGCTFLPVFVTTDCIVECMGHVLVIRRGSNPGKGLIAFPGGFLQPELTLLNNAIKELKEETQIRVNAEELKKLALGKDKVFDHPNRSLRGRTITHAFHIVLPHSLKDGLPIVKGGDDASKAFWMPISSITDYEEQFFEDHINIARTMLKI